MSVKRTRDPAGLLGDHVRIDFTDPKPGDFDALRKLLCANSPGPRIARLRRHQELVELADGLEQRLPVTEGVSGLALMLDIAEAEAKAIYLDAEPQVTRDRKRQAGTKKRRREQIQQWIVRSLRNSPNLTAAARWRNAPEWLTDQIGEHAFRKRITRARQEVSRK